MRKTSAAFAITFAYMLHLPLAAWAGDPLPRAKPEEVGMSTERLALIGKAVNAEIAAGQLQVQWSVSRGAGSSFILRRSVFGTRRPASR